MSGVANDSAWPWAIGAAERYGSEPLSLAKLRQAMAAMDGREERPAPDLRPILSPAAARAYDLFQELGVTAATTIAAWINEHIETRLRTMPEGHVLCVHWMPLDELCRTGYTMSSWIDTHILAPGEVCTTFADKTQYSAPTTITADGDSP